jgi:hypothetical protein
LPIKASPSDQPAERTHDRNLTDDVIGIRRATMPKQYSFTISVALTDHDARKSS